MMNCRSVKASGVLAFLALSPAAVSAQPTQRFVAVAPKVKIDSLGLTEPVLAGHSSSGVVWASPTVMIFTGGLLRHGRITVSGIAETMPLFAGDRLDGPALDSLKRSVKRRPFITVWLFWGSRWRLLLGDDAALARL